MNSKLSRRLMILFGAALAIAAISVPVANAKPTPAPKMQQIYSDHGVTQIPVGANSTMVYSDRDVAAISPDSKAKPSFAYSDHGVAVIPPSSSEPTQLATSSPDSGFNWSRAGFISSVALAGLLLLGGGLLLAGMQSRRRRPAAA